MNIYIILLIILILILFCVLFYKLRLSKLSRGSFNECEFNAILREIGETKPTILFENSNTKTKLYCANNYKPIDTLYPNNRDVSTRISNAKQKVPTIDDYVEFIDDLLNIIKNRKTRENIDVETVIMNKYNQRETKNYIFKLQPMFKLNGDYPFNFAGSYALLLNMMLAEESILITDCKLKNKQEIENINLNDYFIYSTISNPNKLYLKRVENIDDSNESMEIIDDELYTSMEIIDDHLNINMEIIEEKKEDDMEIVYMIINDLQYNEKLEYNSAYEFSDNIDIFKYLLYLAIFEPFIENHHNIFTNNFYDIPYLFVTDSHHSICGKFKLLDSVKRILLLFEFFISFNNNSFKFKDYTQLFYYNDNETTRKINMENFIKHLYSDVANDAVDLNQLINYYNYIIYLILIQAYSESKLNPYKNLVIYTETPYFRKNTIKSDRNKSGNFSFLESNFMLNIKIKTTDNIETYYKFIDNRFNKTFLIQNIKNENLNVYDYLRLLEDIIYFPLTTYNIYNNTKYMKLINKHIKIKETDDPLIIMLKSYLEIIFMINNKKIKFNKETYKKIVNYIESQFQIIYKKHKHLSKLIINTLRDKRIFKLSNIDKTNIIVNLCCGSLGLILLGSVYKTVFCSYRDELRESICKVITETYEEKYLLVNGYFNDVVESYIDYTYDELVRKKIETQVKYELENIQYLNMMWPESLDIFEDINGFKDLKILTTRSQHLLITLTAYVMDACFIYKYTQIPKKIDKSFIPFTIFIGGSYHGLAYEKIIHDIYKSIFN